MVVFECCPWCGRTVDPHADECPLLWAPLTAAARLAAVSLGVRGEASLFEPMPVDPAVDQAEAVIVLEEMVATSLGRRPVEWDYGPARSREGETR